MVGWSELSGRRRLEEIVKSARWMEDEQSDAAAAGDTEKSCDE